MKIFLVLVFGLFLVGFCAVLMPQVVNSDDIYTGKITMSPDEYARFKTTLESPSVKVKELMITPDDSPYVQFSVSVPHGYDFGFGVKEEDNFWPFITLIIVIPLFLLAIVSVMVSKEW